MEGPPDNRPATFTGLTGSVAAGKSEALEAFGRVGAATLSTDLVVHDLLESPDVVATLVERWGDEVAPSGRIDRSQVGSIVFERPEELAWLEKALHPRVAEAVAQWRDSLPSAVAVAVVEVPLLFEVGMESVFDATICVSADDRTRKSRAGDRGTALLDGRTDRQLPQEEKMARATYVIENDGTLKELETAVAALYDELASPDRDAG